LMRMRVGVDVTKKKKIIPTKTGCLLLSISILADTGALHPSYEKMRTALLINSRL